METNDKYCQFCGTKIEENNSFCQNCGKQTNILPKELHKFNWGAFLMNWIWGIIHGKYITLLYFPANVIPIIGPFILSIWFGVKGNQWAWESKQWGGIDEFNHTQKLWVKIWFILLIGGIILISKFWFFLSLIGMYA